MKAYLVGGAVRDKLLGLPVKERDWVVVGSTPEEMMAQGFKPVGKDFPVFLHPKTKEEYALARTERKIAPGYTGFQFHSASDVTLEEDLKRRDLTINAMAMTAEGELIDPYGGKRDLENKIIRHVSDAFTEDPVRILRIARFYARFAALDFKISSDTLQLMRTMVDKGEITYLVPERIWQETSRALGEKTPEKFFEALRLCGALKVIFPEIESLYGVPNPAQWHPEIDTGIHSMMVLQQAAQLTEDRSVRFAALMHDLGKGLTPKADWPQHKNHEARGVELINSLAKRLRIPNEFRDLAIITAQFHGLVHRAFELRSLTIMKLLEKTDALRRPTRFYNFLLACQADARGRLGHEREEYPQQSFLLHVLDVVRDVAVEPLLTKGLKGEYLAQELRSQRIEKIKQFRDCY